MSTEQENEWQPVLFVGDCKFVGQRFDNGLKTKRRTSGRTVIHVKPTLPDPGTHVDCGGEIYEVHRADVEKHIELYPEIESKRFIVCEHMIQAD